MADLKVVLVVHKYFLLYGHFGYQSVKFTGVEKESVDTQGQVIPGGKEFLHTASGPLLQVGFAI